MADDSLGLRGWAAVVPQTQGNLYSLSRLAQQGFKDQRDYALKKNQQDQEWFQKESALGFPEVRTELKTGLVDLYKQTMAGMHAIHKDAITSMDGLGPDHKEGISSLKENYNAAETLFKSFDTELTRVETVYNNDKEKLFNPAAFASTFKDIKDRAVRKDENGNISIDPLAVKDLAGILQNHVIYDDAAVAKSFVGKLGEISSSQEQERADSYLTKGQTYTNGLYETNPDGSPQLDPNYGKPVPKASPEAIALWDGSDPNSIEKQKLDAWAKSIAPEGKNWEDYRGSAFRRFVVDKFGKYKEDKTVINEKSAAATGRAETARNAMDRYWNRLNPAIYSDDETLQNRAVKSFFNPESGLDAEVKYVSKSMFPGEAQMVVDKGKGQKVIMVKKFISSPTIIEDPLSGIPKLHSSPGWVDFKAVHLDTPEQKKQALFELNKLNPDSPKDAEAYDKVILQEDNKYHSSKPAAKKSLGIKWNLDASSR